MFCPNCGKDCKDANFCPKCGTQLQQAVSPAVQSVWQVGMPCPHCGGTKLDGNNCAFCGAQLIVDIEPKEKIETKWSKIPLGVYEDLDRRGYLKLKEDCLVLKNGRKREYTIPYDQITGLEFTRGKFFSAGRLTIRWSGNDYVPFPKSYSAALLDETTFFCHEWDEEKIFSIYHAIRDCIQE